MASQLILECPSSHEIYYTLKGEGYSQPISASVIFKNTSTTKNTSIKKVQISLMRVVSSNPSQARVNRSQSLSGQICRLLSSKEPPLSLSPAESRSVIEELTLCVPHLASDSHVGYSPNEGAVYKIPFHVPIAPDTPASVVTDLGSISYYLAASIITTEGNVLGASQGINFTRHLIPDCNNDMEHTRNYSSSAAVSRITLAQRIDQAETSKILLHAKIHLRQPASPARRSNEFKCAAIRGIRWRMEEVNKLFRPPEDEGNPVDLHTEIQSTTRELFVGYQKGYWVAFQNSVMKEDHSSESNDDSPIEIKLDISIPKGVKPTPEVSLSNYTTHSQPAHSPLLSDQEQRSPTKPKKLMLTVQHRFRFDLVTSEDTFDLDNHNLVDRSALHTLTNVSFPVHLYSKAHGRIDEAVCQGNPPCYDEVPVSPPDYQVFN